MTAVNDALVSCAELYQYGHYLDSIGKIGAGSDLWRITAAIFGRAPELAFTQGRCWRKKG
jgi:hypothetical protein